MGGNTCSIIKQIFLTKKKKKTTHIQSNNSNVGKISFNFKSNKEHQKLLKEKDLHLCTGLILRAAKCIQPHTTIC